MGQGIRTRKEAKRNSIINDQESKQYSIACPGVFFKSNYHTKVIPELSMQFKSSFRESKKEPNYILLSAIREQLTSLFVNVYDKRRCGLGT